MTTTAARVRPLGLVNCDECTTPAYRIVGQTLIIEHRHNGQKHTSVIDLRTLLDRIRQGDS